MKKRITVILAVLAMSLFMLAGCGGGLGDNDPAVGSWEMTGADVSGMQVTAEQLASTGMMDEMPTFEVNADGSCSFDFMGNTGDGSVELLDDGSYEISDSSDTTLHFTVEGEQLLLEYAPQDMIMIFEQ